REQGDAGDYRSPPVQWPGSFTCGSCWIPGSSLAKFDVTACFSMLAPRVVTDVASLGKSCCISNAEVLYGVCTTLASNKSLGTKPFWLTCPGRCSASASLLV